jgi:hypothetical protein
MIPNFKNLRYFYFLEKKIFKYYFLASLLFINPGKEIKKICKKINFYFPIY